MDDRLVLRAFRKEDLHFLDRLSTDQEALGPFEWTGSAVIVESSSTRSSVGGDVTGSEERLLGTMRDTFGTTGATPAQLRESAEMPKPRSTER